MLQLNATLADAACASHAAHAKSTAGQMHGEHSSMPMHHTGAPAHPKDCDTPASHDCCQLGMTCGATFAVARQSGRASIELEVAFWQALNAPVASRITGPEPPPPRA